MKSSFFYLYYYRLEDAAIAPISGSFLSISTAAACWVTDGGNGVAFRLGHAECKVLLRTLRRIRAADRIREMCRAALQQRTSLGATYHAVSFVIYKLQWGTISYKLLATP